MVLGSHLHLGDAITPLGALRESIFEIPGMYSPPLPPPSERDIYIIATISCSYQGHLRITYLETEGTRQEGRFAIRAGEDFH